VKSEVVVNDRLVKNMPGNHGDYYSGEYKDAKCSKFHPWEDSRGNRRFGWLQSGEKSGRLQHFKTIDPRSWLIW
jgi:hypothetical protein